MQPAASNPPNCDDLQLRRRSGFCVSVLDMEVEVEIVKCECCGLKEDCTREYINGVRANFEGKWLCGLCSEAVRDEVMRGNKKPYGTMEEAVKAHMSFCGKFRLNPAVRVADGMRQMLRRRSGRDLSSPASKKFGRSATISPRCI